MFATGCCLGCGYDLGGLRARGRCPECGLSIGTTLKRALVGGPTEYLRRIMYAAPLLMAGFVICAFSACVALGGVSLLDEPWKLAERCLFVAGLGTTVASVGFWLLGWPRGAEAAGLGMQGIVLRIHGAAIVVITGLIVWADYFASGLLGMFGFLARFFWVALIVNAWVLAIIMVCAMLALSRSPGYLRYRRLVGYGTLVAGSIVVVPWIFWSLVAEDRATVRVVQWIPSGFGVLLAGGSLIVVVLFGILAARVRGVLKARGVVGRAGG